MRNIYFWLIAFIITAGTAVYQKVTGPTYPLRGKVTLGGTVYKYKLPRSSEGRPEVFVEMNIPDQSISGVLVFKRYKADESWLSMPLRREGNLLRAQLPNQPTAGKLEYYVRLYQGAIMITAPGDKDVVIRFRGDVPPFILIPHILLMFIAMLISTRAALQALTKPDKTQSLVFWTTGLLFVGGMVFGPLVQKFAFGEYWTGIPFGYDLTDNKTLIVMIGWLIPFFLQLRGKKAKIWIVIAAVLMLVVFSIPHSVLGSQLNYKTGTIETGKTN
jgi:hypothetical protein